MKKTLILSAFALIIFVALPSKADACIKALGFLDPLCVVQGKASLPVLPGLDSSNNTPQTINNTTTNTNSNNVNSNINSTITTNPTQVAYTPVYPTYPTYPSYPSYSPLGISCYANPTSGNVGENIRWGSSPYGGTGNYYITWSGNDGLSGYGTSIYKNYNYSGTKYASVTVTSGGQTATQNCSNIEIYDYNNNYNNNNYNYNYNYNYNNNSPLYVSCTANTSFASAETSMIWNANVSGGNGYYTYTWSGTDYLSGSGRSLSATYHAPGTKTASVTVYSGNQTVTQMCSNSVTIGVPNYGYYDNTPTVPAPIIKYVPVETKKEVKPEVKVDTKPVDDNGLSASALFSLKNVPWGWVMVLVILILLGTVIYLVFNRSKV